MDMSRSIGGVHSRRRNYICGAFALFYKDTGKFLEKIVTKLLCYIPDERHTQREINEVVIVDKVLSCPFYKYEKSRLRKV